MVIPELLLSLAGTGHVCCLLWPQSGGQTAQYYLFPPFNVYKKEKEKAGIAPG